MPIQTAIFGGGCFWCTEAAFEDLRGVTSVVPGYAGGSGANPTYKEVSGGQSGHAEVVKVVFDPSVISYHDLLTVFFSVHDPTSLNRQGNDLGEQYRSVIFVNSKEEQEEAEKFISALEQNEFKGEKIVTEVAPLHQFYPAEEYHRQYFRKNPSASYCQAVINPKIAKLKKQFTKFLK